MGTSHSRDAVVGAGLLVHVLVLVSDEALEGPTARLLHVLVLQPEECAAVGPACFSASDAGRLLSRIAGKSQ